MSNDELLQTALAQLALGPDVKLADVLDQLHVEETVKQCVKALLLLGVDRDTAWAVVMRWLAELGVVQVIAAVEQALESRLAHVSSAQWRGAMLALQRFIPGSHFM